MSERKQTRHEMNDHTSETGGRAKYIMGTKEQIHTENNVCIAPQETN
jgi:hypothetical protein